MMIKGLLVACLLLCALKGLADPVAAFIPGQASGLEMVTVADGRWEAKSVEGRQAVSGIAPSTYLYFRVSSEFRGKIAPDMYFVVDFLDAGLGTATLEYNSAQSPYAGGTGFLLANSGEWVTTLLHVTDAQLRGLQNGGADFRLAFSGPLTISRVELCAQKPDIAVPSNKERLRKAIQKLPSGSQPRNMFYTFGNDADESSAPLFKYLGATSIESYVTWESCEKKGGGQWDWTQWDKQVQTLKDNDLKWVPFLILGPAYSTPNWFRAGDDHFPCRCLEHGTNSKIESLWNPNLPKWIDRFVAEFAKRYRSTGVIESVLLGIQGDFGEAIYSVTGGGWTEIIPGPYHGHAGFWCDDPYALADFRAYVHKRYSTLKRLNKAWGTQFATWDTVDFPGRGETLDAFRKQAADGSPEARRRWLDFVDWYRDSMTRWSDWWMATTRKHFPKTPIYLCTGGDAPPEHGSNFAEQCRVAAKHKAGVRITNEASHYPGNFSITRWVASAGRHYGAYFGFEPAGAEDELGIMARIYNATASGANQLHDYNPNVVSSPTRIEAQRKNLKCLFHVPKPVIPVALWYPNVSLTLQWGKFLEKAQELRDYTDFDYVDETMLRTKALKHYKMLVIAHGSVMESKDARRIAAWMKRGGRVIVMDVPRFESVEATDTPEKLLFAGAAEGGPHGRGTILRVSGWQSLADALGKAAEEMKFLLYDLAKDNIFCTQIAGNEFLALNMGEKGANLRCPFGVSSGVLPPRAITVFGE